MRPLFLEKPLAEADLFPFGLLESFAETRIGIFTLREKWEIKYGAKFSDHPDALRIPSNLLPDARLALFCSHLSNAPWEELIWEKFTAFRHPWEIFQKNEAELTSDFQWLLTHRKSCPLPGGNTYYNEAAIFLEEGVKIKGASLNASTGPIYLGRNVEIMEGSLIRGPFAAADGAVVKMGSRIYGATTLGRFSVVGGEIKNSVIGDFSNKAHDGYLGDSVLGRWCNLGAGTSNSNLKNSGQPVEVWSPKDGKKTAAGPKCGLLMGDFSRSAINTSFNTGTLVGICAHVFGKNLTPGYIPSFRWGADQRYDWEKVLRDLENWKKLKGQHLTDSEIRSLKHIFENS